MYFLVGVSKKIYTESESYQGCFRWMNSVYKSTEGDFYEKGAGLVKQVLPEIMVVLSEKQLKKLNGGLKNGK